MENIPQSERSLKDIWLLDLDSDSNPLEQTLGICWAIKSDCFLFDTNLKTNPDTRRGILSTIASIYDPLGFISPIVLKGKNILQEMCRRKKGWDEPLCEDLKQDWCKWKELSELAQCDIDRCYKPGGFGKITQREVHHFSDASVAGYGQVSYLRLVDDNGNVHCSLLMSKSRVSPLKTVTIPRLELQAAVTSTKVSRLLEEELSLETKEIYWTDSQIVLGYLNNTAKKFQVYVANRVQQI